MEKKLKILFVEDDPAVQALYKLGCRNGPFERQAALDGQKAIEIYNQWQPDIMVVDLMMPGIKGTDVLRHIRMVKNDKKTTVIMATSVSDQKLVQHCLKMGVQGYVIKPINHKTICDKILECHQKNLPAKPKVAVKPIKLLVVEGDADIVSLYKIGLPDGVFEKRFIDNGKEALEMYRAWRPEAMIIDLMVPGLKANYLLQRIRKDCADKTTELIIAGTTSSKDEILRCVEYGISGSIFKPFQRHEIAVKVLEALKRLKPDRHEALKEKLDQKQAQPAKAEAT